MKISEVRAQYPQYADLTDEQLGQALHAKFYADIPYSDFANKVGLRPEVDSSVLDQNDARAKSGAELRGPAIAKDKTGLETAIDYVKTGLGQYRDKVRQNYGTDVGAFLRDESKTSPSAMLARGALNTTVVGPLQLLANAVGQGNTVNPMVRNDKNAVAAAAERAQAVAPGVFEGVGAAAGAMALPGAKGPFSPAKLSGRMGNSATLGTIGGAAQPVTTGDYWTEKGTQTAIGGATGLASPILFEGLARGLNPAVSGAANTLRGEGVRLTPGQILGGGFKAAEEKAQSLPFVGGAISAAKQRGVEDLEQAAFNRALKPIGESLPKGLIGHDAVEFTGTKLSNAYDDILTKIDKVRVDPQLRADFDNIGVAVQNLPKDRIEQFKRIVQNEIGSRIKNGTMSAESLKAAESNLGQVARGYGRSQNYDDRTLGAAIEEAQHAIRGMVQRQVPQYAERLKAINTGWANYMRPQRAASSVAAEDGVFTPAQLHNAVRALDSSKNKSQFSKGNALMQDLSGPAKSVMTDKVRNSGTADRGLQAGLVGGLLTHPAATIPGLLGAIPAAAMYSRPGVAMTNALVAGRQGPIWQSLADSSRALSPLGALVPAGLLGQ